MSEKEYRTALGFIFTAPSSREVTLQGEVKTVSDCMLSAVGLNGDVVLQLTFWDKVPEFVGVGQGVLVSGAFSPGKPWTDKEGNERQTKTISVNKIIGLGENQLVKGNTARPAPKKRPVQDDPDDLGF